jgi:putative endonuclease
MGQTTKRVGDAAEELALQYLQEQGLRLLVRNYRTPGRGGGEIDLIMRAPDTTLVFVEVRSRKNSKYGGALASVSLTKQRRIVFAAQHYLLRWSKMPPCRFDVLALEGQSINWYKGAFGQG